MAFIYILLVINKVFPHGSYKDFIYLFICISAELFFTFHGSVYKALMRTITCNKCDKYKDVNKSNIKDFENEFCDEYDDEGEENDDQLI